MQVRASCAQWGVPFDKLRERTPNSAARGPNSAARGPSFSGTKTELNGRETVAAADTGHTGSVDWIGIGIVVILGVAVVAYGYLWDRTTNRRRAAAQSAAPDRPIPGLAPDAEPPTYVQPKDLKPDNRADPAELDALRASLDAAPHLTCGHGPGAFATLGPDYAVLDDPLIVVIDGEVTAMRELLPAVSAAHTSKQPLVVIAAAMADEVYQTLEANALAHTLAAVAVVARRPADRNGLSALTGATPTPVNDLRMGWLPATSLGHCGRWVSTARELWVLPH